MLAFKGNMDDCIAEIASIVGKQVTSQVVQTCGAMLAHTWATTFNVEKLERLLLNIGAWIEASDNPTKFAKEPILSESLCNFVGLRASREKHFANHKCYELILFIILAAVDTSTSLKEFAASVSIDQLHTLTKDLSDIVERDDMILTQVRRWW
jgi:hypothetical protein